MKQSDITAYLLSDEKIKGLEARKIAALRNADLLTAAYDAGKLREILDALRGGESPDIEGLWEGLK